MASGVSSSVWDLENRADVSKTVRRILIEVFFFALTAAGFGALVTLLFPEYKEDEPWMESFVYFMSQFFVNAIVLYTVLSAYMTLTRNNPFSFITVTVFTNVFFTIQPTLRSRLLNLFAVFTDHDPPADVPIRSPHTRLFLDIQRKQAEADKAAEELAAVAAAKKIGDTT
jgi:hypothetical protein